MPSIRRSLVLSFAQKYTGLLISVPSIMLLARFLTPAETGIFSVALALSNLAHVVRDFGVGAYLIQERRLDRAKLRTAFTITAALAWLIALALYLAGPAAASFYGEAGVGNVLRVIALTYVLIPFGSPASALMRRELAYGSLYIRNTAETLTRNAASVALAIAGFSYMSLAWGSLAGIAAGTLATALLRPHDVWLRPSFKNWRSVVSFGYKMLVIDILKQLATNGNDIVMGRLLGFGATGLFSRGAGLVRLFRRNFQGAITSVAFPAFAERSREGRDVTGLFAKSIAYVSGVAWPFYAFAAIMAYPIILAAYGPQWVEAVPVLRILAVAAAISTLRLASGKLQMATGHINSYLLTRLIIYPTRLGLTVAAAFYSIEAVAAVQVAMAFITIALQYWQLRRHLDLRFRTVLRASRTSAVIAVISSLVPLVVVALSASGGLTNPWIELVIAAAGSGAGWLLGIFVFQHPLSGELTGAWERFVRKRYFKQRGNREKG